MAGTSGGTIPAVFLLINELATTSSPFSSAFQRTMHAEMDAFTEAANAIHVAWFPSAGFVTAAQTVPTLIFAKLAKPREFTSRLISFTKSESQHRRLVRDKCSKFGIPGTQTLADGLCPAV